MSLFRKLFGLPEPPQQPRIIPTSHWSGYLATLIAAQISRSGLADLRQMAAFIHKMDNRPGLCGNSQSKLPDMTNKPDVLVYCYLKDVPTFEKNAAMIERLPELSTKQAQTLAETTGDASYLSNPYEDVLQLPVIDQ